MTTHPLVETLEQWVVTHICDTHPDLTLAQRKAIYRGSSALKQGYALMKAAQVAEDTQALQAAARQTYLAWVTALKAAQAGISAPQEPPAPKDGAGAPDQIVAPAPQESPFRRYHSADLDADILLVPDAQAVRPHWEHPDTIVAYTPGELQVLRQVMAAHPTDFRARVAWLHAQKRLFAGSLERLPAQAPPQEKP